METSILRFDPVTGQGTLELTRGFGAGRSWAVRLWVCPSPLCGCAVVNFECAPSAASEAAPGGMMHFPLEIQKRKISLDGADRPSGDTLALAKRTVAELKDADWKALFDFLLRTKQKIVEEADSTHLDVNFPEEVMWGEGTLVGYAEIFPFANGFPFELAGQVWQIDDQYCIEPDCKCERVLLNFLPLGSETQPVRDVIEDPPAAFYEYKRDRLKTVMKPAGNQPSLRALLRTAKETYPEFDSAVRKRRQQLKALFVRALSREFEPPFDEPEAAADVPGVATPASCRTSAKVGRNDPCPCGSGKKYKTCCGA